MKKCITFSCGAPRCGGAAFSCSEKKKKKKTDKDLDETMNLSSKHYKEEIDDRSLHLYTKA